MEEIHRCIFPILVTFSEVVTQWRRSVHSLARRLRGDSRFRFPNLVRAGCGGGAESMRWGDGGCDERGCGLSGPCSVRRAPSGGHGTAWYGMRCGVKILTVGDGASFVCIVWAGPESGRAASFMWGRGVRVVGLAISSTLDPSTVDMGIRISDSIDIRLAMERRAIHPFLPCPTLPYPTRLCIHPSDATARHKRRHDTTRTFQAHPIKNPEHIPSKESLPATRGP